MTGLRVAIEPELGLAQCRATSSLNHIGHQSPLHWEAGKMGGGEGGGGEMNDTQLYVLNRT